jgi:hypothetical protein
VPVCGTLGMPAKLGRNAKNKDESSEKARLTRLRCHFMDISGMIAGFLFLQNYKKSSQCTL